MDQFPRGRSAIVGSATFGIGEAPGYTALELASRAALQALASAALGVEAVDALFICLPEDIFSGLSATEYLGIQPKLTDNNRTGGSAFLTHIVGRPGPGGRLL